eukprot:scaffold3456_cov89-Skeletonema_marinoi.AAC.3
MLEPRQRCFYTIVTIYDGTLEAVDSHLYSVRYDMAVNRGTGGRLRCPHQVTYDVVATPLRRTNA